MKKTPDWIEKAAREIDDNFPYLLSKSSKVVREEIKAIIARCYQEGVVEDVEAWRRWVKAAEQGGK